MKNTVTVCLTSYNRFNLLKQTVDSFLELNSYPIEKFIVTEDSANLEMKKKIENEYKDKVKLIFNEKNLGLLQSIDNMYNMVKTEYIFHSEDDYKYDGNPNFMQDSIDILTENNNINQIWIRHLNNYTVSHGKNILNRLESEALQTSTGVKYRMVKNNGSWCGFSFNPGLRRLSDYKRLFPSGYIKHIQKGHGVCSEFACNQHAKENGYRAALLTNGACHNMGQHISTYKW